MGKLCGYLHTSAHPQAQESAASWTLRWQAAPRWRCLAGRPPQERLLCQGCCSGCTLCCDHLSRVPADLLLLSESHCTPCSSGQSFADWEAHTVHVHAQCMEAGNLCWEDLQVHL